MGYFDFRLQMLDVGDEGQGQPDQHQPKAKVFVEGHKLQLN